MRPSVVKIANWVVTGIINPRLRHSGRINWSQQDVSWETFCMVSDAISVCCTLLNKVLEEHPTRFTNFLNSLKTRPYNFPKFLSLRSHKWYMATTPTKTLVLKRCKTLIIFEIMNFTIETEEFLDCQGVYSMRQAWLYQGNMCSIMEKPLDLWAKTSK